MVYAFDEIYSRTMAERTVLIRYNKKVELFKLDLSNTTVVGDLLKDVQHRLYGEDVDLLADESECLCDGPYARKPIDDFRLREIIEMLDQLPPEGIYDEESEIEQRPIELWFCDYTNNGFLSRNSFTEEQQYQSGGTAPLGLNVASENICSESTQSTSCVPQETCMEVDSTQIISSPSAEDIIGELDKARNACLDSIEKHSKPYDTSIEPVNDENHTFILKFRTQHKILYKGTACTQSIHYLQAEKSENDSRKPVYPIARMPYRYYKLLQQGKNVIVYIAAIKIIDGIPFVDPLKGFLIDKEPETALENPYMMIIYGNDSKNVFQCYRLQLPLIEVASNLKRECTKKFDEQFNFNEREVDETPNRIGSKDKDKYEQEFSMALLLADGDTPLKPDWSTLLISDAINYIKYVPKAKQQLEASPKINDGSKRIKTN